MATLFARYRDSRSRLRLRKDRVLKLADGRSINDSIVSRRSHWTEFFRAIDWDGDGLMDIMYSLAGSQGGTQDGGSIYLLRNCGTKSIPKFENPATMRCFGKPIHAGVCRLDLLVAAHRRHGSEAAKTGRRCSRSA